MLALCWVTWIWYLSQVMVLALGSVTAPFQVVIPVLGSVTVPFQVVISVLGTMTTP
jgi:hypothetical protein